MQTLVLITRENSEKVTHVMVFLCSNFSEANHFCHLVNRLSLAGGDKLVTRKIMTGAEYSLEKYQPFGFDDFINIDNRTIQCVLSELDSQILAVALKDAFFSNMSKRASSMLEEDMEYIYQVTEQDIEKARQITLDIYDDLGMENRLDEALKRYKNLKKSNIKKQDNSGDSNHLVLVFYGIGTAADRVSVYLFDEYDRYDSADHFCEYLNSLETNDGSFIYAKHADQMVEYETTKPLLVSFDQIYEFSRIYGELASGTIIREALKKFRSDTIILALKGASKQSRMVIMQGLPIKAIDEINESIEYSDFTNLFPFKESRRAQQEIVNAINKAHKEYSRGKLSPSIMID